MGAALWFPGLCAVCRCSRGVRVRVCQACTAAPLTAPHFAPPPPCHHNTNAADACVRRADASDDVLSVVVIQGGITNLLYRVDNATPVCAARGVCVWSARQSSGGAHTGRWCPRMACACAQDARWESALVRVFGAKTELLIDREKDNRACQAGPRCAPACTPPWCT